ncbi:MAG: hypothetical protein DHS20C02_08360 [Micavibrio sp.]|nr:MAG: hypothetical protein DHS20C02_08360 [Micavibrio sp.]
MPWTPSDEAVTPEDDWETELYLEDPALKDSTLEQLSGNSEFTYVPPKSEREDDATLTNAPNDLDPEKISVEIAALAGLPVVYYTEEGEEEEDVIVDTVENPETEGEIELWNRVEEEVSRHDGHIDMSEDHDPSLTDLPVRHINRNHFQEKFHIVKESDLPERQGIRGRFFTKARHKKPEGHLNAVEAREIRKERQQGLKVTAEDRDWSIAS